VVIWTGRPTRVRLRPWAAASEATLLMPGTTEYVTSTLPRAATCRTTAIVLS